MVKARRVKKLNEIADRQGPVVYWMSRDIRSLDNWALIYAQQLAMSQKQSLAVVFCLRKEFPLATDRLVWWLLESCREVAQDLNKYNIPFFFLQGDPGVEVEKFTKKYKIGSLVSDFSPLKYNRDWKNTLCRQLEVPFYEVDTHNIVPVWAASPKQEFGAYTLRPKLQKLLPEYLEDFPPLKKHSVPWQSNTPSLNWSKIYKTTSKDNSVPRVNWCIPGQKAGLLALNNFLKHGLAGYANKRNDPTQNGQSNLSPYLHFGNLAPQRAALAVAVADKPKTDKDAYLEELIIRRELADNFCFYNKNYDSTAGFPSWAQKTLAEHKDDPREYVYNLHSLELGQTHDELWNAAQLEMIKRGKMAGYMRMYWAKKLLEWTKSPQQALKWGIYLNDKYELDGRDPNGYAGLAWSIGGVHDRAWFNRPIYGKIRYMSYGGAKSKFDIKSYISQVLNT